jgi:polar amino acid transport system permease protein
VFFVAGLVAIKLGFWAALARISDRRALRFVGTVHVEFFRNSPEYMLLIWVYVALPLVLGLVFGKKIDIAPFIAAVIAIGFAFSGYFGETFRAGIQSVPRGHIDAGYAVGMSWSQVLRRIVLPQAVRRVLPESLNICISLLKVTTIVSLVTVPDLMYRVGLITMSEMRPLPLYTGAALTYFLLVLAFTVAVRALTDRWRLRGWV